MWLGPVELEVYGDVNTLSELKILVTGDRNWTDRKAIDRELHNLAGNRMPPYDQITVIQGGASGADEIAHNITDGMGEHWVAVTVPADWNKYGRAAGPIRNQAMIDAFKPDIVLAFHSNIKNSKGTIDCIEKANKAGIPVRLFAK